MKPTKVRMPGCWNCKTVKCSLRLKRETSTGLPAAICHAYERDDTEQAPAVTAFQPPVARVTGIWNSDYVCKMGLKNHCEEVLTALDNIQASKMSVGSSIERKCLEDYLEHEMMDLYIIASTWAAAKPELLAARLARFAEKAGAENAAR